MRLGDRGEEVRRLQLLLLMTGVSSPGAPDGAFGPRTLAAVEGARDAFGLAPGDEATQELLTALAAQPRRPVRVPRVRTPATVEELVFALELGYETVFARRANPFAASVACAQLQQEHGADPRAIWVYNLGNQDAVPPWAGPVFRLEALEVLSGRRLLMAKSLRAYAALEEGAAGYWERLAEGYPSALPFFERGDPAGAAEELKRLRYYTGDLDDYRRGMVDRFEALGAEGGVR